MVQVPADTPLTLEPLTPLTLHTAVVVEVKVTGLPDAPLLAETAPLPPTTIVGAAPKLMVWPISITVMLNA